MSEDWPSVKLSQALREVKREQALEPTREYRLLGIRLDGAGPFERETRLGSQIAAKKLSQVHCGDFIYSRLFAWRGAFGVVPPEMDQAWVSNEFPTFVPSQERIDLRFLTYWFRLRSTLDAVEADCSGSTPLTRNRFKEEFFFELQIPLPPLPEQRRIVAKIDQLAAKIEEARGLREASSERADALGYSAAACFFGPDQSSCPRRPLEELASRITKGESPSWQGFSYQDHGPLFVRSENVLWGHLDARESPHISPEFHAKLHRSQLRSGDVLINLVGASIGRSCVVPDGLGDANVNQAVGVISPGRELGSSYLMHFLLSPPTQDVIHGGKVETARPNISLRDLTRLAVPVPPLEEQRRIVEYLDGLQAKVDRLKELQAATAAELDALLPSILDKAFKGEL
jgi:type I restriction enzyme S subunit